MISNSFLICFVKKKKPPYLLLYVIPLLNHVIPDLIGNLVC